MILLRPPWGLKILHSEVFILSCSFADEISPRTASVSRPLTPTMFPKYSQERERARNFLNVKDNAINQDCVDKLYALASGCPAFNSVHSFYLFRDKPRTDVQVVPNYMKSTIASKSRSFYAVQ